MGVQGSTTLDKEEEGGMMAFAGDTQQALVPVGVQDSTHMAGEYRAGDHRTVKDRAGEDRSVGSTDGSPLPLTESHSWRDTGFLLKQRGGARHFQFGNTLRLVLFHNKSMRFE